MNGHSAISECTQACHLPESSAFVHNTYIRQSRNLLFSLRLSPFFEFIQTYPILPVLLFPSEPFQGFSPLLKLSYHLIPSMSIGFVIFFNNVFVITILGIDTAY